MNQKPKQWKPCLICGQPTNMELEDKPICPGCALNLMEESKEEQ